MQATEIEKARAVARRALQTINQRHEVERLNVQIALLNLEHLFGTQVSDFNYIKMLYTTKFKATVCQYCLYILSKYNKNNVCFNYFLLYFIVLAHNLICLMC